MHPRVRGAIVASIAALVLPSIARAQPARGTAPAAGAPATDDVGVDPEPDPAVAPVATAPTPDEPGAAAHPPADPLGAHHGFSWRPFGYLRLQYRVMQNDPNIEFIGRNDGFELQNARIGVIGGYRGKVDFVVALEGANNDREKLNEPQGTLRDGLRDAYADITVRRALDVRVGYFRSLVDPDIQGDNLEGDTVREFIDRPIESRGVRATEGYEQPRLTPGRSIGAALRLDPDPPTAGVALGFEVAVQNGADEDAADNDNDTPALSATGLLRLPRNGWIVASGRYNRRTEGELPFRQDEDDLQGSVGARIDLGAVVLGGGAMFVRTSYPTVGSPGNDAYGAHGQVAVKIPASMPVVVGYRFGVFDASSLIITDRVIEHTLGAVVGVPAYRMRMQLQVTHVVEQESRTLDNSRIQLAAEVSL